MSKRLTARDVIDRLTDGGLMSRHADKWGESMGAHFTIAHALDDRTMFDIGAGRALMRWQFRPGMGESGLAAIEDPYVRRWIAKVRTETLLRAGEILHRYENCLDRAGHSY